MEINNTIGSFLSYRLKATPDNSGPGWFTESGVDFLSYREYGENIQDLCKAFHKLELLPGTKIGIWAETSKNWHLTDMAIMCSRLVTVPIYSSLNPIDVEYLLNHSEVEVLFLQDSSFLEKISPYLEKPESKIKHFIFFDDLIPELPDLFSKKVSYLTFSEFLRSGGLDKNLSLSHFNSLLEASDPSDLATIIYTSGTSGVPKGAMISHQALCQMLINVHNHFKIGINQKDRSLIMLPLAHVFGRSESLMGLVLGWEFIFSRGSDFLLDDLKLSRPTILCSVPRIYEKIYKNFHERIEKLTEFEKVFYSKAMKMSEEYFSFIDQDLSPPLPVILQREIYYRLFFQKINSSLGGKIKYLISGGAPLSLEISSFLRNCGFTILEGYGLTETAAACVINPLYKQRLGTVGIPIGDVLIHFSPEQEIIIESKALFYGYYKDQLATEECLKEGHFYTGDIGHFDEKGYLKITDRKKDILITSAGKNIAPQKIENLLKNMPHISHAVVLGEGQKYLVALIGIEKSRFFDSLEEWGLAADCGLDEVARHPEVRGIIQREIDQVNVLLSPHETIKRFSILSDEISVKGGQLTPSLKIKRSQLANLYSDTIDAMYKD